ncbi:hypothetical protein N7523_007364, partial [Penicillium sp. IBT 18751x]
LLHDPPGTYRYPSPVSITTTPPSSSSSDHDPKSPKVHSHKPERHPLPARPLTEVCVNGLHSETQTNRRESEGLAQTLSAVSDPSKQPRASPTPQQIRKNTPRTPLALRTKPHPSNADDGTQRGRLMPIASQKEQNVRVLQKGIQESALIGGTKVPSTSFPTVRAQFSALSVEDRLQFLSWLVQGVLSHCASTPSSADAHSASGCISSQYDNMNDNCDHTSLNAEVVNTQHTSSRKGLSWSIEEDRLLIRLRDKQISLGRRWSSNFHKNSPGGARGQYKCTGAQH